jgi:hypothetical protein
LKVDVAWGLCAEIFATLTQEQRDSLKAVASGKVGTVRMAQLGKLKTLGLIHSDVRGVSLTAHGRVIAEFC